MPMASKGKTTYSYDRVSHKSLLSPYWFTYALCVGDLSKAASGMPIICWKNKKAIVCGETKYRVENERRTNCEISVLRAGTWTKAHWHITLLLTAGTSSQFVILKLTERERNAGGNAEMLAMLKPTLSNFSYLPGHLLCTNETVISHFSAFKRETFL